MDDAFLVGRVECVRNLQGKTEQLTRGKRGPLASAGLNSLPERLALKQLHHEEVLALVLSELMDGADIGMVERGGRSRFALKSLDRLRIVSKFIGKKF